jgi:hypothetical protein
MPPVALPAVVGANVTVKVVLAPALIDFGAVRLVVKPVPETVAAVILRVALPVFVSVTVWLELLPTATLPKATGDGLIVIVACVAVPDPLKLIGNGDPGALLVIDTLPVALPAVVGANVTVKLVVWPGAMLAGALQPVSVKPVPVML